MSDSFSTWMKLCKWMVSNLNYNVIIKHINRWGLIVTAMLFLMLFAGFGLLYIAILQEVKQSRIAIKVAAWVTIPLEFDRFEE